MAIVYEDMATLIPNTSMQKMIYNGTLRGYYITPNEGYAMHDSGYDHIIENPVLDENGNPLYDENGNPVTEEITELGYRTAVASVGYNYDFTPVEMQDETGATVTAYGSRQFFCKPISEVGEGAEIFGGNTEPEHEVMNTEPEQETM